MGHRGEEGEREQSRAQEREGGDLNGRIVRHVLQTRTVESGVERGGGKNPFPVELGPD